MQRLRLDQAAIALSGLCMVHCLASVAGLFAIGLLSAFGSVDEVFHLTMLAFIVPVSMLAMVAGYRRHRRRRVLLPGLLALMALCLLTVFESAMHGTFWEPLLTSLVGICLMATHFANIRACKHCEVTREDALNEDTHPV
ncbi:MAG: MerC domain-containing protein [Pseudomonadales bacterium]|nr:MerC domain-containing protein [Pseudomonadales bacterium]